MNRRRRLVLEGVLAATAGRYTLRVGDKATIPAINQHCAVYEGGAPELYCARPLHPRHQVTIFRDSILISSGDISSRASANPSGPPSSRVSQSEARLLTYC